MTDSLKAAVKREKIERDEFQALVEGQSEADAFGTQLCRCCISELALHRSGSVWVAAGRRVQPSADVGRARFGATWGS